MHNSRVVLVSNLRDSDSIKFVHFGGWVAWGRVKSSLSSSSLGKLCLTDISDAVNFRLAYPVLI